VRKLRGLAALILVLALVGAVAGCTKVDAVARVNGDDITRAEFDRIYQQVVTQMGGELDEATALNYKRQLLDMMIESVIVTQEAERLGADLSEEAIDAGITELMGGSTDMEAFEAQVAAAGLTMEDLRKSVRDQIAREFVTEQAQSEADNETLSETYSLLSHILVNDEAFANDLHAQLVAGGDFAELASVNSSDTGSAMNGGSLGWSPTTAYVSELADAADALEVGALSAPIKSDFGWHIILKVDQVESGAAIADAPEELQDILAADGGELALQAYVAKLRESAEIEYLDETLAPVE
jgi:parvulin-like peptidyl-prolyl isomerase